MKRYSERRIRLVTRKTRLDDLIARHNTVSQARFVIERQGGDFSDIETEHNEFTHAKIQIQNLLDAYGKLELLPREFVSNYIFGEDDLVVCLGQDGLVANVLKYLPSQTVVGVNPDLKRWDGVLLPYDLASLATSMVQIIDNKISIKQVKLAEARFTDGQIIRAVNDLFIGANSHISARYAISFNGTTEFQSSSGVIVSTGLGSTGWYSSLVGGKNSWDYSSNELRFCVREAFKSKVSGSSLISGVLKAKDKLKIESRMGEKGVVFSDGIESDHIEFNAGSLVEIGLSEQSGWLLHP